MSQSDPVAILGAGIAGLTAALCLAQRGFAVEVIERAQVLSEVGAGLQLSPNAMRVLSDLGLAAGLAAYGVTPDAIVIGDGVSGEPLTRLPLGDSMVERYGAPYLVIHRGALQAVLLDAARQEPRIRFHFGMSLESVTDAGDRVLLVARSDSRRLDLAVTALIGADGVRSEMRRRIGGGDAVYSGRMAWRATCRSDDIADPALRRETGLWLGTKAHFVHYPIDCGRQINLVAAVDEAWMEEGWDVAGDPAVIAARFADWPDTVRNLVAAAGAWRKWALCAAPADSPWTVGRIALIGDAVHAMLPFVAQGGAMAIEDARILADTLAATAGGSVPQRLAAYAAARAPRTARVVATARRNATVYHLSGLAARMRNSAMRLAGPQRLAASMDWIYDWRPSDRPG